MLEIADALSAVVAAQGPAYGLVAHSLGAAAISQALKNGLFARRMVFVATATDFQETVEQMEVLLGFGPRIRRRFQRRFTLRFGPMDSFEVVSTIDELAEERELPPLLVIHDKADRETAYQGSVRLAAVWPRAEVELTEGLGHNRVLRDEGVIESARSFVSSDRAPGGRPRVVQETMQG